MGNCLTNKCRKYSNIKKQNGKNNQRSYIRALMDQKRNGETKLSSPQIIKTSESSESKKSKITSPHSSPKIRDLDAIDKQQISKTYVERIKELADRGNIEAKFEYGKYKLYEGYLKEEKQEGLDTLISIIDDKKEVKYVVGQYHFGELKYYCEKTIDSWYNMIYKDYVFRLKFINDFFGNHYDRDCEYEYKSMGTIGSIIESYDNAICYLDMCENDYPEVANQINDAEYLMTRIYNFIENKICTQSAPYEIRDMKNYNPMMKKLWERTEYNLHRYEKSDI